MLKVGEGTPVLFTDADNTLWDTNAVFARAQVRLLHNIELLIKIEHTVYEDDGLTFLRRIDQRLASEHPENLRYPPHLLAEGLALALEGSAPVDAAKRALSLRNYDDRFEPFVAQYINDISEMPELRPGVAESFSEIGRIASVVVVTESSENRCRSVLANYGLTSSVGLIVHGLKSVALYERLASQCRSERLIMVGDQIDRDITFPREAGFETVWFPGDFTPFWSFDSPIHPDHIIARYDEIMRVLQGDTSRDAGRKKR